MRAIVTVGIGLFALRAGADEDLLARAAAANEAKRYGEAHDLAIRAATAPRPEHLDAKAAAAWDAHATNAWRLAGSASCFQKERSGALQASAHLKKDDVQFIRFACDKNGVTITDEDVEVWASPAASEIAAAQGAYAATKYAEAKRLALQATAEDPKLSAGWRLLGSASCWTRDKVNAQKACDHLQPVDQETVRSLCARTLGVQLKSPRVLR